MRASIILSKTCPMMPTNCKNYRNTENRVFHKNMFFYNFKWYLGGLGVSRGCAWTIRTDSLELWRDLVLHGMGEVDFHVFGKYWKFTSSPNTSKLVLGVAHTVFFGCGAHDILWVWRTRYLLGVAHTIFCGPHGARDG